MDLKSTLTMIYSESIRVIFFDIFFMQPFKNPLQKEKCVNVKSMWVYNISIFRKYFRGKYKYSNNVIIFCLGTTYIHTYFV